MRFCTESSESNRQAGQESSRRNQPPAVFGSVLSPAQSTYQGLPKTRTRMSAASVPAPVADL